ncbi:hypothetical protein AB0B10_25770 [Micromonospora arborensis]|uniref:hypothetical protein n=1 Tax=Micromonospora arborensis TaxID=2116518 RepID=UPI0033F51A99
MTNSTSRNISGRVGAAAGTAGSPDTTVGASAGGRVTARSVSIEGITTEAMWRDLEQALGLSRYELGRFKQWWTGPRTLDGCYDLDAAARWAQRNGLAYEDERTLRYDPAGEGGYVQRLVALAAELGVGGDELTQLVMDLHSNLAAQANHGGAQTQVRCLVERYGAARAEALIRLSVDPADDAAATVVCGLCGQHAPAESAHRHQGGDVGECCWDERLNATA